MLQRVTVVNYALVDQVEFELGAGLNIFTGETGAGKSILISAVAALLGEKTAFNALRDESQKAVVEGLFVNCLKPELRTLFEDNGIEAFEDESFIIRREFHPSGRSRAFINDSPITATVLAQLSEFLVDLHGQHEHQSLLQPKVHLHFLDAFAGLEQHCAEVAANYQRCRNLQTEYDQLQCQRQERERQRDMEIFQLQEIKQIDPQPGEDKVIKNEVQLLSQSEHRAELAGRFHEIVFDSENAIHNSLTESLRLLEELAEIDPTLKPLCGDFRSAEIAIRETAQEVRSYQEKIEFDAGRLEQLRERLVALQNLQKKYGGSLDEVLSFLEKLEHSFASYEALDDRLSRITVELQAAQRDYRDRALQLHEKRINASLQLEQLVPNILEDLGLAAARFKVEFDHQPEDNSFVQLDGRAVKAGKDGIDQVSFHIATNSGQQLAPLAQVASGGEISRIMLALKSIIAEHDNIPILIFDEIDNGVSGRIAQACGRRLQKLAESHQIVCITHLPQIASAGHYHFLVEKTAQDGETLSSVRRLNATERARAIASLLGGEKLSATHLQSAIELLEEAGNPVT